jgi:hypothetical protein
MRERLSEADLLMDVTNRFAILADGARLHLFQRGVEVRGGNQQSVSRPKIHRIAVKHLLSVNRSIRKMVQDGRDRDEITTALVHLAVSLKYLESRNEQRADL